MYDKNKEITLEITIKYEYDSELEQIKEIISEIIKLKGLKELEICNRD